MSTSRVKRMLAAAGIAGAMTLGTAGVAAAAPVSLSSSLEVAAQSTHTSLGAAPVLRPGHGDADVAIGSAE